MFKSFIENINNVSIPTLDFTKPIWIFGAGGFGKAIGKILVDKGFNVQGFVQSNSWDQIVDKDVQIVFGIFNREVPFDQLKQQIRDQGFENIFMPWHIYSYFENELGWRYWLSNPETITRNIVKLKQVYDMLSDDVSKKRLLDIASFRLGINLDYAGVKDDQDQYFNDLTLIKPSVNYIDGGAYDGKTLLALLEKVQVNTAYLFEPDAQNYSSLTKNLVGINATCIPMALSDTYRILSFNANNGEGSAISTDGSVHIAAGSLDEIIGEQPIDFVKLDVEGAEADALAGSINIIKQNRPVLAISLYHRAEDLWDLPLLVSKLCNNYKFYIRQHYYNSFDCVLYAVPL